MIGQVTRIIGNWLPPRYFRGPSPTLATLLVGVPTSSPTGVPGLALCPTLTDSLRFAIIPPKQ